MLTLATSSLFSTGHIALTVLVSGVLAAAAALVLLKGERRRDRVRGQRAHDLIAAG